MPTFATPAPIAAIVELVGDVRMSASDRDDTVVTVHPGDPTRPADVKAAEQTTVELTDGRLTVRAPRSWLRFTPFGGTGTIRVTLELPTGSQVSVDSGVGAISGDGEIGACRLKTAMGDIRLDQTGPLIATTAYGAVTVDRVAGTAEVSTGTGAIRIEALDGAATIRNSNGSTSIGEVAGDLRVKASNGDIVVRRAHNAVTARTANGDVRVLDVQRGSVVVETAAGELEIGIRKGTAAWFDAITKFGAVRNRLDTTDEPAATRTRVEVRARTSIGDILIGPAPSSEASPSGKRSDS